MLSNLALNHGHGWGIHNLPLVPSAFITAWISNKERSSSRPWAFHGQPLCFPSQSGEKTLLGPSSVPLEGKAHCEPGGGAQHGSCWAPASPLGLWVKSITQGECAHTHTCTREQDKACGHAQNGWFQPLKKRIKPRQCLCFKNQNNNNKKTSQVNYPRAGRNL